MFRNFETRSHDPYNYTIRPIRSAEATLNDSLQNPDFVNAMLLLLKVFTVDQKKNTQFLKTFHNRRLFNTSFKCQKPSKTLDILDNFIITSLADLEFRAFQKPYSDVSKNSDIQINIELDYYDVSYQIRKQCIGGGETISRKQNPGYKHCVKNEIVH